MKIAYRRERQLLLAVASVLLHSGVAWADGVNAEPPDVDDTGFAVLSNATNVTHWGLGVGAGFEQAPYKGYGTKFSPIPLLFFDDKWVHAVGTTIDLKIGTWDHVSVALRGKYALGDGYKSSDAPILNGMQDRNGAFWFGPALAWRTGYGDLTGDFLTGGNKGQMASLDFGKTFSFGKLSIEPHVGAEWLSRKYVDYYYGVRASEARPGRAAYNGTSTFDTSVGARFDYHFTRHQLVSFDIGVEHLGSGITNSPLVGKRYIPQGKIGYLYQFN
ncbi:MipA/OmpV family protein [Paraburkholderia sp. GAS32]|uniref:MipA/OmpV family protein n=1 Tax=Paraburkholderia sp. GAS32 TaxID=3035129 RepID=UPI003D2318E0